MMKELLRKLLSHGRELFTKVLEEAGSMKYSARLVTALAAAVLLVGAIVGLSTRAEAATSVPMTDTAVVQAHQVDLPGVLQEGGGADLAFTQIDVTFDETATPLTVFTMDRDVGSELDTALTLTVGQEDDLAAPEVAALISTGSEDDVMTPVAVMATGLLLGITMAAVGTRHHLASRRRSRQSGRAHAPLMSDAANHGIDGRHDTTAGTADTSQSGTSYHPRA